MFGNKSKRNKTQLNQINPKKPQFLNFLAS